MRETNAKMQADLDALSAANKEKEAELAAKEVDNANRILELQRVETLHQEAMEFVAEAKKVAERKEAERLRMEEEKREVETRLASEVESRKLIEAQHVEANLKTQEELVELKRKEEAYGILQAQLFKEQQIRDAECKAADDRAKAETELQRQHEKAEEDRAAAFVLEQERKEQEKALAIEREKLAAVEREKEKALAIEREKLAAVEREKAAIEL